MISVFWLIRSSREYTKSLVDAYFNEYGII